MLACSTNLIVLKLALCVCRGDVTLECAGPEPVTISNATFDSGKHTIKQAEEAPALPAGANVVPAFA